MIDIRNLTLLGKIVVIKSLAIPKFTFALTSLYISDSLISEINKSNFNFLWSDKPDKIKRDVITRDFALGGLKMTDFSMYVKSIKLTWLTKLYESDIRQTWHSVLEDTLNVNLKYFLTSPFQLSDIPTDMPLFYRQILCFASKRKIESPNHVNDILRQNLFYNRFITINGKSIFFKRWYRNGFKVISDILTESFEIRTFDDLQNSFNSPINFLEYNKLKKAIPTSWLNTLQENVIEPNLSLSLESFDESLLDLSSDSEITTIDDIPPSIIDPECFYKKSKMFYIELLSENNESHPTGPSSLAKDLKCEVSNIFDSFCNSRQISKSSKIICMQYKICHKIVACNQYLHQTKIRANDLCEKCKGKDTIEHFFFQCIDTTSFWNKLTTWYDSKTQRNTVLTSKKIILGCDPADATLAHIILYGKWYIYRCKMANSPIIFKSFLEYAKSQCRIEKFSVLLNNSKNANKNFNMYWKLFI